MNDLDILQELIGQEIKAVYQDGEQIKIARGILQGSDDYFIKVYGPKGLLILNKKIVERISFVN